MFRVLESGNRGSQKFRGYLYKVAGNNILDTTLPSRHLSSCLLLSIMTHDTGLLLRGISFQEVEVSE